MQSPTATERLLATTEHLSSATLHPSDAWIHPRLTHSVDPIKGRQLLVSQPVRKGELLLVDRPYALIPAVDEPETSEDIRCSNAACHRAVTRDAERVSCPGRCVADVVWCGLGCRDADAPRHQFECTWLKKYARAIRAKWGEYDFGVLWLIVRILASRQVELGAGSAGRASRSFKVGWDAIQCLCGSQDTWAHSQVRHWTVLAKKYLASNPSFPHGMGTNDVVTLICQEEANSFGLYPRETGVLPLPDPPIDRGEQFGAAVYPTAAIANHSCSPNIIHKSDNQGRMVFVASRDIAAGEECCISYFDLTQFVDLQTRRDHLQRSFRFVCKCDRCTSEEPPEEEVQWDEFPAMEL
ncbi:hypothetical protein BDV25DRAFT_135192 [Aspergillus avenaceus]|uniref:SET domain-containing protein n=1 Tax=Aspergillus avenaceus TaxID=36643 RepID=A0A5N6U951_ASPAV|nr:hypothetical protein BDV25DRAFT_135192 [Aspergillus avenaceus]